MLYIQNSVAVFSIYWNVFFYLYFFILADISCTEKYINQDSIKKKNSVWDLLDLLHCLLKARKKVIFFLSSLLPIWFFVWKIKKQLWSKSDFNSLEGLLCTQFSYSVVFKFWSKLWKQMPLGVFYNRLLIALYTYCWILFSHFWL